MKQLCFLYSICMVLLMSGCSSSSIFLFEGTDFLVNESGTMELEENFTYEIPEEKSFIKINVEGYQPDSIKLAYIEGKDLTLQFEVKRKSDHTTVFTETLQKIEIEDGTSLYIGDFSEIVKEGTYYLYQEDVGYSEEFTIEDSNYEWIQKEYWEHITDKVCRHKGEYAGGWHDPNTNKKYTIDISYQISKILLIYELQKEEQEEMPDILEQLEVPISNLIQLQNVRDGSMPLEVDCIKDELGEISLNATAAYAGALSMYASAIREYDQKLANSYVQYAKRAYQYVENSRSNIQLDIGYFALVSLLRETKQIKYQSLLNEYLTIDFSSFESSNQEFTVLGDILYLLIEKNININYGKDVLNKYLEKANTILAESKKATYQIAQPYGTYDTTLLYKDIMTLGVAYSIESNRQYSRYLEHYLNYLLGTNPASEVLLSKEGEIPEEINFLLK
ncbi:MAG: cellulase N-terminal Ig-like domain-containing protein [Lachnospiraceae bacterium]